MTEPDQPESGEPDQANLFEVPVMVAPFRLDSLLRSDRPVRVPRRKQSTRGRQVKVGEVPKPPPELEAEWSAEPVVEAPIVSTEAEPEPEPVPVVPVIVLEPEPEPEPEPVSVVPVIVWEPEPDKPLTPAHAKVQRERRQVSRIAGRQAAIIVLVVVVLLAGFVVFRVHSTVPNAIVTADLRPSVTADSPAVSLPWPPVGEAAVSVPSIGFDMPSAPETSVPIASLTKLMTAYIILRDHPLRPGQNGPMVTITQDDLTDYNNDTVTDQANAQVELGENISEKDLLGGMLVHSANNFAGALARWDAGSIEAFVAKMNVTAASLGMIHTHYVDASGYDQDSQSTPEDLLKVAAPDMANSVFASFVKMPSITLPIAGTLSTYTPLLGTQGVLGVKSGFTTVAGGCDVLAVRRVVLGKTILVITAVTGQTGPNVIDEAGLQALNLANATAMAVGETTVVTPGELAAHVSAAGSTESATVSSGTSMLSWPGVVAYRHFVRGRPLPQGAKSGSLVGSVVVQLGSQREVIPVRLRHDLSKESLLSRIL